MSFLTSNTGISGIPVPAEATAGITFSGSNCMVLCGVSARTTIVTGWTISCKWDGVAMTPVGPADGNLNGFGSGKSYFFYLPVGTVAGLSANAVALASNSETEIAIALTVAAYDNVAQASPLNATSTDVVITSSTTVNDTVNSNPTDLVVGNICFAEVAAGAAAVPTSGQSKRSGHGHSSGSPVGQAFADDSAEGGSFTNVDWGSFNSSRSCLSASFLESVAPSGPIINDIEGASYAAPNETDVNLNGANLNPAGTTKLFYADSNVYATANKVEQTFDTLTSTTLNWLLVDVGSVGEGDNFLYVVTDFGGGGELISDPFPCIVTDAPIFAKRVVYVSDGTIGDQLIIPWEHPNPQFGIIRGNSAPNADSVEPDAVYTMCFVDRSTSMGHAIGSSSDPDSHQREQVVGTGSLILMDGGNGGHLLEGTPRIENDGLYVNWTTNTIGYNLEFALVGGESVLANLHEITISASPKTGLGFRPDGVIASSDGVVAGGGGDTSFALMSWGIAIDDAGVKQFSLNTDQSSSTRNAILHTTAILGQIVATSFTWEMAITSFDADGYTWTGSNSDGAHVLAVRLPGHKMFLTSFNKVEAVPGDTQLLPDIGFEPGVILLGTCGRNDEDESVALGARYSIGFATGSGQDVSGAHGLPQTGSWDAEQFESFSNVLATSMTAGVITTLGKLVTFEQVSKIEWVNTLPTSTILIGMFAIEGFFYLDLGEAIVDFHY